MYEYLSGKLTSLTPATAVIDCGGVGYLTEITLNTYSAIQEKQEVRLWIHEVIREDAYLLYGFYTEAEREMFRLLIGVNGVGAATARMMLSSLSVKELGDAIASQDAKMVQRVKGVGKAWEPRRRSASCWSCRTRCRLSARNRAKHLRPCPRVKKRHWEP